MFTSAIFCRTGRFVRGVAVGSALVFAVTHLPLQPVAAEMIGTGRAVGGVSEEAASLRPDAGKRDGAEAARGTIRDFMARDHVRTQLERLGVNPDEAQKRVSNLSDEEARQLAQRIESAPAGAGVGAIIGAALVIFLVLLATDLLGFTSVFPFTNKGSANPA